MPLAWARHSFAQNSWRKTPLGSNIRLRCLYNYSQFDKKVIEGSAVMDEKTERKSMSFTSSSTSDRHLLYESLLFEYK